VTVARWILLFIMVRSISCLLRLGPR